MGKRIFWIFMLMVVSVTTVAVLYIQSESFAKLAKEQIQTKVVRELGVELNFDRLKIGVLPPSLSLLNVSVKVLSPTNPLGLSQDTVFNAERLGFTFRMIQAFSGGLAINKVFLSDAEVRIDIPKSSGGGGDKLSEIVHRPIKIQVGDGFVLHIRQLELRNTMLDLGFTDGGQPARFFAKQIGYLAVTPASEGTDVVANIEEMKLMLPKTKETIKALKVGAYVRKNLVLISSLDVQRKDAVLHAAGKLVGSIDNAQELRPDLDIILRGPINEISDFEKSFSAFEGDILAEAKVVGRLKDPAVQGKVEISGFRHGLWRLDKVSAVGSYGGGMAIVDTFDVQQGSGRIGLKNKLELPIPFKPEPKTFQLRISKTKFQDVAGDLLKDVNNLRFETDGTITVRLEFAGSGAGKAKLSGLSLRPELAVRELELNNQVFNKQRPYKRIFKVGAFNLAGNVLWRQDQGEVRISDTKITLPTGALDVRGTVREEGFDLYGSTEQVDFGKEVGEIAGIPVAGEGAVRLHVHGPGKAVLMDFDLRQKNARFVNFDFGEINGRVTYDDKRSYLTITDLKGSKNSTQYAVNGSVNVGEGDDISLATVFEQGNPDDLFAIFAHQLKDISWIPHGMTGSLSAGVKVGGGYDGGLKTLQIDAKVRGKNLSYKGEMIHEFEAEAGLKKGTIFARNATAKKYETMIQGSIDYNLDDTMRYSLDVERGKLRNIDLFTAWALPVDGLFRFHSEGKGKWETLESTTIFDVTNSFVRTKPLPPLSFSYNTFADRGELKAELGQDAQLDARIASGAKGDSTAELKINETNFDYFLCLLSKANCTDPSISFRLKAGGKFSWKGRDWTAMNGAGMIHDVSLAKAGFSLRSPAAVDFRVQNGLVESGAITLEGESSKLVAKARGKVDGTELDNRLQGQVSMKVLEFATPLIEEARGKLNVDLSVKGDSAHANFQGKVGLQEGFLRLTGLDAPVDELNGTLRFNDSRITMDGVQGQLGGGTAQVAGGLNLYLNKAPKFEIDLFLANNRLKFFPVNFAEISDAKLSFTGDHPPYLFAGTARVKRVMMRSNFDALGGQKGLQNARYLPEKLGANRAFYETKLRAVAEGGVMVENSLLNAEFKGEIILQNNFEFPQMIVRADMVRGKLIFGSTTFTLDHVVVRNPNPELFDPQILLGGSTTVDPYKINIFVSGTASKPKITLSSTPSISQPDIVSLLTFGYRGDDAKKLNSADTNNIAYSEVGSILLDQLQINQNLQSKGLRFVVAPSVTNTEDSIVHPHTATSQAAPKVYIQSQIMRNLEASFGGTVGASQGQSLDARLEYRLGRKASVSAVYEQTPGLDVNEVRNSYGGDLKFRWGFR